MSSWETLLASGERSKLKCFLWLCFWQGLMEPRLALNSLVYLLALEHHSSYIHFSNVQCVCVCVNICIYTCIYMHTLIHTYMHYIGFL